MPDQIPVDYDALATQARGASTPIDYEALAAKARTDSPANFSTTNEKDAQGNAIVRAAGNVAGILSPIPAAQIAAHLGAVPDIAKGVGEGLLSTARGIAGVLPQRMQDAMSRARQATGLPPVLELSTPANNTQKVAKFGEQIGEFFVPSEILAHVLPAAGATARMLTMAGSNALLSKAQGAGPVGTGVSAVLGAAGEAPRLASALTDAAAARIERTVLRGTAKDYANGFNPSNVFRYQVGGTPLETYAKSSQKLNDLGQEMKSVLQADPSAPPVDLSAVNQRVLASYRGNKDAADALERINKAVQFELNGAGIMPKLVSPGRVGLDLADANKAKQAVGQLGAWLTDPTGRVVSDADRMTEQVANRYYAELKKDITANAGALGPKVRDLNRQMADLIPIKTAAWRRFPVADRQNVMSLLDNIGAVASIASGNPLPAGVAVAGRLAKSGTFADALSRGIGLNQQLAQGAAAGTTNASQQMESK